MQIEPRPPEKDTADLGRSLSGPGVEYAQLRADVATRLSRVCREMAPEAFDALVDDICAMKVRWARKSSLGSDD